MPRPRVPARVPARETARDRRAEILAAALEVFAAQGFAAARLDDVAARAGVAKGTLYLHFASKQDLFEKLVSGAAAPVLSQFADLASDPDRSTAELVAALHGIFEREVLGTHRKDIMRLVLAEGARFPAIAQFWHREVVSRGLAMLSALAARGVARGEIEGDALVRFPHLIMAPLLVALLWEGLFASFAPLDVPGLLQAHRTLLFPLPPDDPPSRRSSS